MLLLSLMAGACTPERVYTDVSGTDAVDLPSVVVGETTRESALMLYGLPAAQFEGERILTWRMGSSADGRLTPVSRELDANDPRLRGWKQASYSLVMVFGADGRLEDYSLVKVK